MNRCHELTRSSANSPRGGRVRILPDQLGMKVLQFASFTLTVFLVVVSLHAPPAYSQARLLGQVTGNNGVGKSFARLEFFGPQRYVAMSDRRGWYAIQNFHPGQYNVTIRQGGNYQKFSKQIGSRADFAVEW